MAKKGLNHCEKLYKSLNFLKVIETFFLKHLNFLHASVNLGNELACALLSLYSFHHTQYSINIADIFCNHP